MRTVATMTAMILKSMLPPRERESSSAACARSGGPGLGNFERVAIDCGDIENFAGLARHVAGDVSIPQRVAIPDARVAGALVNPRFEAGGLSHVDPPHGTRNGPLPVLMHPDDAGDRDGRGGERLPHERPARIRHARARESGDAGHEQIERSAGELRDDQNEACDQPDEWDVHERNPGLWCRLC